MRGSPLFRLVTMAIALAMAGIPVWVLTRPTPEQAPPVPSSAAPTKNAARTLTIRLTASVPATMSVSRLGETVLETKSPARECEGEISMDADSPEDLVLRAQWPESEGSQAVRVEVESDGDSWERTFWGKDGVEDVIEKQS